MEKSGTRSERSLSLAGYFQLVNDDDGEEFDMYKMSEYR